MCTRSSVSPRPARRPFFTSRPSGGAIGGAISRACRSSSVASRSRGDNVGGRRVRARSGESGGGADGVFSAVNVHPRRWSESDGNVGGPCGVRRSSSVGVRRSISLACVAPGPASGESSAAGGRGGGGMPASSSSSSASHLSPSRASSTWALSRSPSPRRPPTRTPPSAAAAAIVPISSPSSSSALSSSASSSPTSPADGNNNVSSSSIKDDDKGWPAPHPSQAYVAKARCGQRYEHDVETGGATRIRAVVSDLDGTLLGPDKLVSPTTLEAVRKARAKGIIFVPASGRSKLGMISVMGELGQELQRDGSPIVCMNGLTVYGQGDGNGDLGEIIHSELMCPELAARVVAFWKAHPLAEAAGVSLCGSEGETIVVETLDPRTSSFPDWGEPLPKEVGSWQEAIAGGMGLNRLYFWGPTRAAVDAFEEDLKEHLQDHPAELTRGVPEMIEVLPHGASKAVGLEALLKTLGVSPEEVIAVGDMENDVEMLRSVGHGIAMGQASLEVRRAARFTAPTNELHGVAVALETFCGI
ncbi:haloacid dehalogenase-like hydrolase [Ectocarpus siliculosus]|uniref:Haloacid dehalogenase-like hydrolase n=1 Tax=Ectocarpus siliculosus TaxID=2880 RepID=D8LI01_ECTSI|nr:haloacid dehalogenase-like hydrolase [Ectocarpus siliculosus]|eukprot:CBN74432.1 haloacid dehalogenase-like hydrolase [Ectocarpus siliculosus]